MIAAIYKRAGGRRRYNKERQRAAQLRRRTIVEIMVENDFSPGWQSWLAEEFGVHHGTISRDIDRIVTGYQDSGFKGLGPRTNAKVQLLDELTRRFEQARLRRGLLKDVRESKKARKIEPSPELTPCAIKPLADRPTNETPFQSMTPNDQRIHPFPHSIPRQPSRFDRMRCFPRDAIGGIQPIPIA